MAPLQDQSARAERIDGWLERYRMFWEERLDRLDAYLQELQAAQKKGGRKS